MAILVVQRDVFQYPGCLVDNDVLARLVSIRYEYGDVGCLTMTLSLVLNDSCSQREPCAANLGMGSSTSGQCNSIGYFPMNCSVDPRARGWVW